VQAGALLQGVGDGVAACRTLVRQLGVRCVGWSHLQQVAQEARELTADGALHALAHAVDLSASGSMSRRARSLARSAAARSCIQA
jgi:hypothetical protein